MESQGEGWIGPLHIRKNVTSAGRRRSGAGGCQHTFLVGTLAGGSEGACRRDGKCSGSTVAQTRDLMESDQPVPHMDRLYPAESVPGEYADQL